MIRFARSAALAAAIFLALSPLSGAMAQGNSENHRNDNNGDGPGNNGQGHAYGHDKQDDAGGDTGGGDGDTGGGGGGDTGGGGGGETGGGGSDPQGAASPTPVTPSSGGDAATPSGNAQPSALDSDSERALEAVRSNRALPLEDIVATATQDHPGKLIDAELITVENFLLYELKLLEPDGDVRTVYYYARSGIEVRED